MGAREAFPVACRIPAAAMSARRAACVVAALVAGVAFAAGDATPATAVTAATSVTAVTPATAVTRATPAKVASRLARLVARVADHEARSRLDEPDVPGRAAPLVPVTQQVIEEDRAFRAEALRELNAIEAVIGTPALSAHADVALLRALLDRLAIERDELRHFETDPGYLLPRIDNTLRALLAGRRGALCHRLGPATQRLRAVPELLRASQVSLSHPSRVAVEHAMERFEHTLSLYRREMPDALAECRDSGSMAKFSVADTLAARALTQHSDWLRGIALEHADGEWSMGRERFTRWLRASTGDTIPLDELRARIARELELMGPAGDSSRQVLVADSSRAAVADRMLQSRAASYGRGSSRWLRTVLGRREWALAWGPYAAGVRATHGSAFSGSPHILPTRLDRVGAIAEIDLHTGAASIDEVRGRFEREAGLDSTTAMSAARACAIAPSRAVIVVALGWFEALRIRAGRGNARFSPQAFLRATIDAGAVPVPMIQGEVLARLRAAEWVETPEPQHPPGASK